MSVITKVFCIKPPPEYIETFTREGFKHNIKSVYKTEGMDDSTVNITTYSSSYKLP